MADEGQKFEGYSQVDTIALDDVFILVDKSDTTHSLQGTTKYCTAQQIANLVAASSNPAVENSYLTIAAMLADQGNQTSGQIQYADDASADPTVASGYAFYTFNGTAGASLSNYTKLSEEETFAITRGARTWLVSDIQDDTIHLTEVASSEVGLEYNDTSGYMSGLLLSIKFTNALEFIIADASSVDYYVKIYNQNYDKYFQAPVTSFTVVNTDYVRANIGGTIPATDEIEIGHLLEISFDIDVQDGAGDMLKSTYDPTSVEGDAFDMDNMVEGSTNKILTAAERTILGNTSGTNTGDQDLSGLQPKPSEGQFVDGDKTKLDGIEAGADVTDATNVDAAGAVMEVDFNANTILAANTDDTPAAVTIAEQEVVGRITSGNIKGLSQAELRTLLAYLEELIDGTADEALTVTGATNVDLSAAAHRNIKLTGNATLTFTNTPASGKTITRTYKIYSDTTETLGFANSTAEYGEYVADGTENLVTVMASNTSTEGLDIHVFFSTPS